MITAVTGNEEISRRKARLLTAFPLFSERSLNSFGGDNKHNTLFSARSDAVSAQNSDAASQHKLYEFQLFLTEAL